MGAIAQYQGYMNDSSAARQPKKRVGRFTSGLSLGGADPACRVTQIVEDELQAVVLDAAPNKECCNCGGLRSQRRIEQVERQIERVLGEGRVGGLNLCALNLIADATWAIS